MVAGVVRASPVVAEHAGPAIDLPGVVAYGELPSEAGAGAGSVDLVAWKAAVVHPLVREAVHDPLVLVVEFKVPADLAFALTNAATGSALVEFTSADLETKTISGELRCRGGACVLCGAMRPTPAGESDGPDLGKRFLSVSGVENGEFQPEGELGAVWVVGLEEKGLNLAACSRDPANGVSTG